MKIIKVEKCRNRECPYNITTYCEKVIIPAKNPKIGMNHLKRFTRIERSGKYDFPEWCPLENYKEGD